MPKGHHCGRTQLRSYTTDYHRISAKVFKSLLTADIGNYCVNVDFLSREHQELKLTELENGVRLMTFNINKQSHKIVLKLDNRSASNKLYITCPYCQKKRQHLYAIKTAYVCRECVCLNYTSQSERTNERLIRRIRKLRIQLWGYDWPDVDNMFNNIRYWSKPRWMRWGTFEQKRNKIIELENIYWPMAVVKIKTTFNGYFMTDSKK
jgi:hypothetical protein